MYFSQRRQDAENKTNYFRFFFALWRLCERVISIFLCVLRVSVVNRISKPALETGLDELIQLAVEHRLGVAGLDAGAQVLDT